MEKSPNIMIGMQFSLWVAALGFDLQLVWLIIEASIAKVLIGRSFSFLEFTWPGIMTMWNLLLTSNRMLQNDCATKTMLAQSFPLSKLGHCFLNGSGYPDTNAVVMVTAIILAIQLMCASAHASVKGKRIEEDTCIWCCNTLGPYNRNRNNNNRRLGLVIHMKD